MMSDKATRALLVAGAVLNGFFVLFHLLMGWRFLHAPGIPEGLRPLLIAFNTGGVIYLAFFAWAFATRGTDLLSTALGRGILWMVALIYLSRAAEEILLFRFNPMIFATCAIAGAIPAALLGTAARRGGEPEQEQGKAA
jgi:hypothetical protein